VIDGKIEELEESLKRAEELSEEIREEAEERKQAAQDTIIERVEWDDINDEHLEAFGEQPYILLSKAEDETWIIAPRFVPFQVGWLERQTDAYNVFVVNKYVDWITDLPDDVKERVGIEARYEEARVDDGVIEFSSEEEREEAWDDLGGMDGGLSQREGDDKIKIKNGSEFQVIAEIIDRGNLPFTPQPVADDDLRPDDSDVELRQYQERAWEKFKETGMVGIYWPPGAGKTFISLYAGDRIKGDKLVVVPSSTLEEQWEERIDEFCQKPWEWEVRTYQYITQHHMDDYQSADYALTIYDECHHLPANTFSKLATIDTTYRIGLSASPYREDERTDYIFALTGFPIGLKWQELIDLGVVAEPDVKVYLYSTKTQKKNDVEQIVNQKTGKVLIFCDSIQKGKRLSSRLDVPFVHGETRDRMDKFRDNRVVISSRVGDEGLSLDDINVVVEYDFHGGSRRQEAQRAGRVMHGEGDRGEHIILMTDEEYEDHGNRLYSLEEQGFNIRIERRR
jgi:DNA excision repair protein ERCC-3